MTSYRIGKIASYDSWTVSALVVLAAISQGMGLLRDFLLARAFSITADLEGYFFAEAIPLAVTVVFVTAFPLTVLPRFVHLRMQSEARCDAEYRNLLSLVAMVLVPVLAAILLLAPQVVELIGAALPSDTKLVAELVLRALAINVVGIPVLSLNTAYLNARGSFVLPAATLLLMNSGAVLGLWLGHAVTAAAIGSSAGTVVAVAGTNLMIWSQLTRRDSHTGIIRQWPFSPNLIYVVVYVAMLSLTVLLERRLSSAMGFGAVTLVAYATKMVGMPQYLFTMSYVRMRIAQYSKWVVLGDQQAVRQDFMRSVGVMVGVSLICAAAAGFGGIYLAELLFGALTLEQATHFQYAIVILSAALLPMFVNALFVGVASASARLSFLVWPSVAQTGVLALAAWLLPEGLGAPAATAAIACGHIVASLVWLATSRRVLTSARAGVLLTSERQTDLQIGG